MLQHTFVLPNIRYCLTAIHSLQHTHCNILERTPTGRLHHKRRALADAATHHVKLQHTHCNTSPNPATTCNNLQHTAISCNTLQNTATHCNILQNAPSGRLRHKQRAFAEAATRHTTLQHTTCNKLQHTATHCNTLQHTATRCNTLTGRLHHKR